MTHALGSILVFAVPLVLVPTVMIMRHLAHKREWEHAERMKALELGLPAPGNESWAATVCIAIGAGVPVGALCIAWLASLEQSGSPHYWIAATVVGSLGVLSGTLLATRLLPSSFRAQSPSFDTQSKPELDPDAYDVAGRRG
jgi:hypothetical protein